MKMENEVVRSSGFVMPSSRPIGVREGTGIEAVRVLKAKEKGQRSESGLDSTRRKGTR